MLEDLVLKILFDYRMNSFNRSNAPMPVTSLATAARVDEKLVKAVAESLIGKEYVEKTEPLQGVEAFRITGSGVVFIRNIPQGIASVL